MALIQYGLYAFNYALCFAALCIFGFSVYVFFVHFFYVYVLPNDKVDVVSLMLIIGCYCSCILSYVGCCSSSKEKRFCLMIYCGLMIAKAIFDISAAITAIIYISSFEEDYNTNMEKLFTSENIQKESYAVTIAGMQKANGCCGLKGPEIIILGDGYPTCICGHVSIKWNCTVKASVPGCKEQVKENIRDHLSSLRNMAIILVILHLVGAGLAIYMIINSDEDEDED